MRQADPDAKLAAAQLLIAREHGLPSWRALKAQIDPRQTKRRIASPAMRFIAVASLKRSVCFYRDVLGFQIMNFEDEADAVLGPVRIRLWQVWIFARRLFVPGGAPGWLGNSVSPD
jgi:hypothetical protein